MFEHRDDERAAVMAVWAARPVVVVAGGARKLGHWLGVI